MSSRSSLEPRRIPQQERGQRRVASLLRAAAFVIADVGYESTTMCAIARRAGAAIGSLYQFFPNKEAVAEALRAGYIGEIEALWASLALKARTLSAEALVNELVRSYIKFAKHHRAFVALLEAPPTVNSWQRRALIRGRIARVLMTRKPRSSRRRAMQTGAVVHQIVKGLLTLYARAEAEEKTAVVEEFKSVLIGYLRPKL
ncbi:MAG: TetR family transcriptional regulator [Terriglobia bacterium]